MAAVDERQDDSLGLRIPSLLIGGPAYTWMQLELASGRSLHVTLRGHGAAAAQTQCSGEVTLTGSSGRFSSNPLGEPRRLELVLAAGPSLRACLPIVVAPYAHCRHAVLPDAPLRVGAAHGGRRHRRAHF